MCVRFVVVQHQQRVQQQLRADGSTIRASRSVDPVASSVRSLMKKSFHSARRTAGLRGLFDEIGLLISVCCTVD